MSKHAFYSMFGAGDYTLAPWKVGWRYIAEELTCAVITNTSPVTIPDHRIVTISCQSEPEAYFLCGTLNSTLARLAAGFFLIETQIAPQVLGKIAVPKFEPSSKLHQSIVVEAKRLSEGASDARDSVHEQLDALSKDLWGVTEQELKACTSRLSRALRQRTQGKGRGRRSATQRMNRLPHLFKLQAALEVLSQQTDVLPAVGGAIEDELRPDTDEMQDQEATKDDKLLDEPFEFGQSNTYVPLQPLKRPDDHVLRFFQDGSMRSFFIGTCLEHDRQTPVILGQVGCVSLFRHDDGRLSIGPNEFRNLLMVGFQQISTELKAQLEAAVTPLGETYHLCDIESKGREGQDLRARAADTMRSEMTKVEMAVLTKVAETAGTDKAIVVDGAVRIAQFDRLPRDLRR